MLPVLVQKLLCTSKTWKFLLQVDFDDGTPLKLYPKSGTIGPVWSDCNYVTVYAELGAQEVGPLSIESLFHIEGHPEPVKMIVGATVMKHSCQVVNEHGAFVTAVTNNYITKHYSRFDELVYFQS